MCVFSIQVRYKTITWLLKYTYIFEFLLQRRSKPVEDILSETSRLSSGLDTAQDSEDNVVLWEFSCIYTLVVYNLLDKGANENLHKL